MTTAPQAGTSGFEGTGPNASGRVIARLGAFGSRTASAGAVAPGAGDRFASVYLDTTTEAAKQEASFLVLACQNGAATFSKSAPSCFMGDTAIKVALEAYPGDPGSAILEVSARLRPGHLTHAFVCRNRVALRGPSGATRPGQPLHRQVPRRRRPPRSSTPPPLAPGRLG